MMNTKENSVLDQSLVSRQRKIQTAKDYLARTQQLFEEFGSAELKTSHARFTELESALNSDQVRLVVLGEFTRGKSRLLNALLNIDLLPTALETTTAVNTFLRALPAGRSERFILIHYQDKNRPPQEVSWTEDNALIRWGTELDKSNADARMEVDYIEVFLDHPLLQKGLVLVDTPGLKTIVKHHEQITRKAIAESHIALWVQATDMLGGSESEWDFMSDTLRGNFQKFITVINKWDRVLEPEDYQDKQLSEAERVQKKLQIVKSNFASILGNEDSVELATLTDANHLMGVSAQWAQDKDPEKRRRSNIDHLAERIGEMVSSGEAMKQILLKPLQQIATVQKQLADRIQDELKQLESTDSLEKRQQELQQLEIDIRNLESDEKRETLIAESVRKLSRNTTAQLTQTIKFLDSYANDTIHAVFMDQAALLKQCVSEQLLEPVNAKRAQLQEIETLLHQGKAEIAERKAKLTTAQRDIAELQALTHNTLNA